MVGQPSYRRFIATMAICALALIGIAITGVGGFPLLALASIIVLGTVDACFRSFDTRHRAATVGTAQSPTSYYELDLG
ncbi:MAG: hypothetical protein AB7Q42_02695 [Acidimicrobiia bacterium]